MSNSIDKRIVEMQFDNQKFERNVSTTQKSLNNLNEKLKLSNSAKGFESIEKAAKSTQLGGISKAVDEISNQFSTMGIVGMTVLMNLTNQAVNTGKRIISALTIDPVKTGFQEYETQINAIQTILANTESKGTTLKDVSAALDELNKYADMTIYNFTEMTRNIGTFTAAGVDLDTATNAIKGIANLAAVSGSNSQQASTAMYQLSQAMATGTVKLMDWNSVVNAGMGGQVFQDALKETARVSGVAIDDIIKKNGSFRDSLQEGWLTTQILTDTLDKFTGDLNEQQLRSKGYNETQIKEIMRLGEMANDAATKVKTVTQLWDTLKEAAQSGWTQTWQLLVGDFEEAKTLLTGISDTINGFIGESANARNEMLKGWKDMGGRTMLIESFKNIFEGLGKVVSTVSKAFREFFPKTTSNELMGFTKGFNELSKYFKIGDETLKNLKDTFRGIFSVMSLVWDIVKKVISSVFGLTGGALSLADSLLKVTGAIGRFLVGITDAAKQSTGLDTIFRSIGELFSSIIDTIFKVGTGIKEFIFGANEATNAVEKFGSKTKQALNPVSKLLDQIGESIGHIFENNDSGDSKLSGLFDFAGGGMIALAVLGIKKLIDSLSDITENMNGFFKGGNDFVKNINHILEGIGDSLQAFTAQIKSKALLNIAIAIGILAASLLVLASIPANKLDNALVGLTMVMFELVGAMALVSSASKNINSTKLLALGVALTEIAAAMLLLSVSIKILSTLKFEEMLTGLIGFSGILAGLVIFLESMGAILEKRGIRTKLIALGASLVLISTAILGMTAAVALMGSLKLETIIKGLTGLGGALFIMTSVLNMVDTKGLLRKSVSFIAMGVAMLEISAAMIGMATAILILQKAVEGFSKLNPQKTANGLLLMAIALGELAVVAKLMTGSLSGAAAMVVMSTSLIILSGALGLLGGLKLSTIGTALLALTTVFISFGITAKLLAPIAPALMALSTALAVFGVAVLAIGAGVALFGTGLTLMATSGGVAISVLHAVIVNFAKTLPVLFEAIGRSIGAFFLGLGIAARDIGKGVVLVLEGIITALVEGAPMILDGVMQLFIKVLDSLLKYIPDIVNKLVDVIIKIIKALGKKIPAFISATMEFIGQLFGGIVEALGKIDVDQLLKGSAALGIITLVMKGLSTLTASLPGAMAGVISLGILIGELALVLAAIGALNQIPGLNWLAKEGGELLQTIGTSIGKFVGGIVGGIAEGIMSSLPNIATSLSTFMINLKPFLDGAKDIDPNIVVAIGSIAGAILALTAANVIDGLTSWLTGGNDFVQFGKQLNEFAPYFVSYSKIVKGIDGDAVVNSATAAKVLSEFANNIPNSGGLAAWFAGSNNIDEWGARLPKFGAYIMAYSNSVKGIDGESITASATAAKVLSELANNLPNSGGVAGWFMGENDIDEWGMKLPKFGAYIMAYAKVVKGLDGDAVVSSANAAKSLAELANNLPNSGGVAGWFMGENDIDTWGEKLPKFGKYITAYAKSVKGMDGDAIVASANAAKSLAELANNLPNEDGFLSGLFGGTVDMEEFGNQLDSFGKGIKKYYGSVKEIDGEIFSNAVSGLKTLVTLDFGKNNPRSMIEFSAALTKLGEANITAFVDTFKNSEEQVKNAITTMLNFAAEGIKGKSDNFSESGNTYGQAFVQGILLAAPGVPIAIATLVSAVTNGLASTSDSAFKIGVNFVATYSSGISSAASLIINSSLLLANGIVDTMLQYIPKIQQVGITSAASLSNGLKSGIVPIKLVATSLATAAINNLNSGGFRQAGINGGVGFANGLLATLPNINYASTQLGLTALNAIDRALDSHSPSREGIKRGKFMGEGLILGIIEKSKDVFKSSYDMGKNALTGLSKAISKIDLQNNMPSDAVVITPVLDTTNIDSFLNKDYSFGLNGKIKTNNLETLINSTKNSYNIASGVSSSEQNRVDVVENKNDDRQQKSAEQDKAEYIIEVPVNIDGRQVAKSSAKFMKSELDSIQTIINRKGGIK